MRNLVMCLLLCAMVSACSQEAEYSALDPRGTWPTVERIPLAGRLDTLDGKQVYLIMSWDLGSGFDETVQDIANAFREVGAIPTIRNRNLSYSQDDPELWAEMRDQGVDGFVYVAAASSSTTSYAFKWSAHLESTGLPGVVAAFDQLASVGETTNQREGAPVRSVMYSYPTSAMDDAQYAAAIDATLAALTTALAPAERQTGEIVPPPRPKFAAEGALETIQRVFYETGLTDGLPIVPPTEAAVRAMLGGTSHAPDEVVAEVFYPEGLEVTVRQVAINAVMAGCLPGHMPVLLATIEAYQKFNLNSMLRSTNSFSFMQVVNGPIAQELDMNAGFGAVGPGNLANAAMGRALRLFVRNLGGGETGVNLMAVLGNNTAYGFMFAENEAQSPWEPFSVSQGFDADESTLTLFSGGWTHFGNYNLGVPFDRVTKDMVRFEMKSGATVLISPQRAEALAADGMSKADVIEYLWRNATMPLEEARNERFSVPLAGTESRPDDAMVPVFDKDSIHVIVAGGDASPMMQVWHMYRPQTVSIDKWR